MEQLILLQNNELDEALDFAFNLVGEEEFEVVTTLNFKIAKKQISHFENNLKWVIMDSDKFFLIALDLIRNGLKLNTGEIIKLNLILISPYKQKKKEKEKVSDVKLTLF
tara:strand:+ start:2977 stop:3303 length:327 start_codon:yes stop_codon:yes gene_type:complete